MYHRRRSLLRLLLAGSSLVAVAPQALTDDLGSPVPANAGRAVFLPADFAQFAPQTALDMAERLAGVAIVEDDSEARGFGQARGNVLINGQRVSGKSNGARNALGRIPAARVERIEVAEASVFGISGVAGQAFNVVTSGSDDVSGAWRFEARWRDDFAPALGAANLSLSGTRGNVNWTLEAANAPERRGNQGPRIVRDGAGNLTETRDEKFYFFVDSRSLSGSLGWKPPGGIVANLNAKAQLREERITDRQQVFALTGVEGRRVLRGGGDGWNGELGGDLGFNLGPGRLKLIALARQELEPFESTFLRGGLDGSGLYQSAFSQTTDAGEYILRGEYGLARPGGHEWQVTAEGAFNVLEAATTLSEAFGGGPLVPVSLDASNTRVEEVRGEAIVTHTRPLARALTLQLAAGAELSEISQSGDTANVRQFSRPKGFANLSWKASDRLTLVTRFERKVGQLDFEDFVTSVDLALDAGNAGNTEIVPPQSWILSAQAEQDFAGWGAATLKVKYESIEDIVDRVPIGAGDGPGNLDSAWAVIAELNSTLKFDPIGFKGARLRTDAVWIESRVEDPLTGIKRPINDDLRYEIKLEFRHDIPSTPFAWGSRLELYAFTEELTLNERRLETQERGLGEIFIEHKNLFGLTGQFAVRNILDLQDNNSRTIFAPDRRGSPVRFETSLRERGTIFFASLRGAF